MGASFRFICRGCGYAAEVSGGRDVGMLAVVLTSTCQHCLEVVDVAIGYQGQDGLSGDPEFDRDLGRCPLCRGTAVAAWPDERPCPKCGDRMDKGDLLTLWD